jgi:hypothetical protein
MLRLLRLFLPLLALLVVTPPASAQTIMQRLVTPGPLSNAHARFEAKCEACHEDFSRASQTNKCLACHKGIAEDVRRNAGFHGKTTARNQQCKVCHSDHHGRGFKMVSFNAASFNHNLTDYPLEGGHAKVKCAACHGTSRHFRATSTSCASCHAKKDPHFNRLGKNCQACHTVFVWKKTKPYDHAKTGFALTGQHRTAACMSCHAGQRWSGTPQNCAACHARKDVHNGSRGTNCASCHVTSAWKSTSFNHDRDTNFPLIGRHESTSCAGCHGANNHIRKPARTCIACHAKNDVHKGVRGTSCANCHAPSSWKATSFNHTRDTSFPLLGKHAATACAGCHGVANKTPKPGKTCIACHAKDDSHKGSNGTDCARCHTSRDWKITSFDHDKMTRFALVGGHKGLECKACHIKAAEDVKPSMECISCHLKDDAHATRLGRDCASCHNVVKWKEKVLFDHALTRFPLLGKHGPLLCTACHADKSFASKGITCQSCHIDEHHAGQLGETPACARCHTVQGWKFWQFDHDKETEFPLTGKHQGLICSACHSKGRPPKETTEECASCHARDDIHRGKFGRECSRCHVTSNFSDIQM